MENWIDCHVHVLDGGLEAVEQLAQSQKEYGYSRSNFLSVEGMGDAAQNALAIYFKLLSPDHYAFGSMHYRFQYDFVQELEQLHAIGLDGIKMIENKPTERKKLGFAQDDVRYSCLYRRAEALDIPFLIHVNDPREFWDPERAPAWAVEAGYAYTDGSFVPFEQILEESEYMLRQYPRLRVCFAHMMFLSDDCDRLESMMERYPNLHLDITSGTEMYVNFSAQPERWKAFFRRYGDRIFYGTDNCNRMDAYDRQIGDTINDMQKRFLTEAVQFPLWDSTIQGFGLEQSLLEKITVGNFRRFAGERPRPLNRERAAAYIAARLEDGRYCLTEREEEILRKIYAFLRK